MKRSKAVTLLVMGTAAIGLAGCKPKPESYPDAEACIASGTHTESECRDAFAAAAREHESTARHFAAREDCIAAYGPDGCEERQVSGGDHFFMPLMMGYMLGRGFGYHPLYRDPYRQGGFQSSGGVGFGGYSYGYAGGGGSGFGRGAGPSTSAPSGGETSTVSRGGFGATGEGLSAGS